MFTSVLTKINDMFSQLKDVYYIHKRLLESPKESLEPNSNVTMKDENKPLLVVSGNKYLEEFVKHIVKENIDENETIKEIRLNSIDINPEEDIQEDDEYIVYEYRLFNIIDLKVRIKILDS